MSKSPLRLDIQGLRALAVGLVVVFHLAPAAVPGGYIGVDVFFVISGFLITAHLLREVADTGSVKLLRFWARRVRRLLPAAFLVLAVSAIAVQVVLPATLHQQNFTEIAFATVYLLNWKLASSSVDYLAADNVPSIAQHYWSLSVEEQFYIVWPLLILAALWFASRGQRRSARRTITVLLVLVGISSLVFSVFATAQSQPSAYFVTTTRAWEFAAGGLIACVPLARLRNWQHQLLSWLGLALIVGSAFAFSSGTAFPGWIAILPVMGTVILLWVGDTNSSWAPQYLAKAGPVQLLGDTSYGVYLWHWPLIVIATSILGRAPGWIWGSALLIGTLTLALVTKYLVEDPIRKAPFGLRRNSRTFAFALVGTIAVLALCVTPLGLSRLAADRYQANVAAEVANPTGCFGAYAILNDCPDPYRVTDTVNPSASASDGPFSYIRSTGICEESENANGAEYVCDPKEDKPLSVMLVGDSHAYSLFPGAYDAAQLNDWGFGMLARVSCPGLGVTVSSATAEQVDRCAVWSDQVQTRLLTERPVDVVLFAFRQDKYPEEIAPAAEKLFTDLAARGTRVLVQQQVPESGPNGRAPSCVEASNEQSSPCAWDATQTETWMTQVAERSGATLMNPWDLLCHDGQCENVVGGTVVYRDSNHFTGNFSRTLAPWLSQEVAAVLPDNPGS